MRVRGIKRVGRSIRQPLSVRTLLSNSVVYQGRALYLKAGTRRRCLSLQSPLLRSCTASRRSRHHAYMPRMRVTVATRLIATM
jgi:hypothetical protein